MESVALKLRETLSSSSWIPESARPTPPVTQRTSSAANLLPATYYEKVHSWFVDNKILAGSLILSIGATTYYVYRKRKAYGRKRRAKRASNGARLEVVVIAGPPSEPITRSLSMDLERRGFIVYVVCNSVEEEVTVQNESRPDIKPLMIDIVDVSILDRQQWTRC